MIKITDLHMSYPLESASVDVLAGVDMTIADGETRCAAQNLKSHFSCLHSTLRQKYRVERFPE